MSLELGESGRVHANLRPRPGDLDDLPEQRQILRRRLGRRGGSVLVEALDLVHELSQIGLFVHVLKLSGQSSRELTRSG